MKRLVEVAGFVLVLLMFAAMVLAAPWTGWVPLGVTPSAAASRMIAPPIAPAAISNWAPSTAYGYGTFVRNTNYPTRVYWCISAGTTSNDVAAMPDVTDGDDSTDPSVTWRYVRPVRNGIEITAPTNAAVWLAFGDVDDAAVVGRGIRIATAATWRSPLGQTPEGAIHAIQEAATATTNTVGVQEW